MTFETKNERNDETTDVWETLLARRLADDLDAFLETASDETFLFAEETNASRRRRCFTSRRQPRTSSKRRPKTTKRRSSLGASKH